jgi:hypothetical protein
MLFDLTFPCYLTTFSGKKCLSGKVICVFFVPLIEVLLYAIPTSRLLILDYSLVTLCFHGHRTALKRHSPRSTIPGKDMSAWYKKATVSKGGRQKPAYPFTSNDIFSPFKTLKDIQSKPEDYDLS